MAHMFFSFLSNALEPFAYFIFSVAFLFRSFKDSTFKVKVLCTHYIVCTLLMSFATWQAHHEQDNRWVYNILWFQSSLLICYYFHQLFLSRKNKQAIIVIILVNVSYFLINNIYYGGFYSFDSLGYSVLSLSVSIIAFLYFYNALTHVNEKPIWYDFNFWLVTAYLIYFLVSFAIFLTYHQLTNKILPTYTSEERRLLTLLWGVQNSLLFLSALTTLFGYVWTTYRSKSF